VRVLRELRSRRSDLRRLIDEHGVADVIDRFAASIDARDYEGLTDVLTPDAIVEGWSDAPWAGAGTIKERLREINAGHFGSHRMVTNHRIAVAGDRARCSARYRSTHLDGPQDPGTSTYGSTHSHEGWYLGELSRTQAGWRISRLKHVSLSNAGVTSPEGRAAIDEIHRFPGQPMQEQR